MNSTEVIPGNDSEHLWVRKFDPSHCWRKSDWHFFLGPMSKFFPSMGLSFFLRIVSKLDSKTKVSISECFLMGWCWLVLYLAPRALTRVFEQQLRGAEHVHILSHFQVACYLYYPGFLSAVSFKKHPKVSLVGIATFPVYWEILTRSWQRCSPHWLRILHNTLNKGA
jgi:hypothetical protein